MTDASVAISVAGLSKSFGEFKAVDDVSFRVLRGEIFGFLGPNGAGKTTTIRLLLGLMRPTSGRVAVLGHGLPDQAKALHARVGYMSQAFTLYDDLTPIENLRFYGRVYGLSRPDLRIRQAEIVAMAGLGSGSEQLVGELSGGWRQRLALGCAIIHRPELVFLDEPTAGVSPVARRDFWELIYGLARQGTTVFVTTHHMDEAELCQRLAFISAGRLVAMGTPDQLKSEQMWGRILELTSSEPEATMRVLRTAVASGRLRVRELAFYGAQIHVVVADEAAEKAIIEILTEAGIERVMMNQVLPSLEDVFIAQMNSEGVVTETWGGGS